jgi:cation:H+ antiporter
LMKLSELLNINSSILTAIIVSLWTSLPELVISVKAAMHWKHWIALWNIFWSNTFNVLAVSAVPAFIWTLTVSETVKEYWILFLIFSTLAFIFATSDSFIQKWEWMALLILYIAFIWKISGLLI